jgi:iron complex transport system ATP-binding protein
MPDLFNLDSVCAHYGRRMVLDTISLTIKKGSLITIIGPNGSGKSTLLSVLCGSKAPSSGTILFNGKELSSYSSRELASLRSPAFLHKGELPDFTVAEYVGQRRFSHQPLFSSPGSDDDREVFHALEFTGTTSLAAQSIKNLSSGEFQLVSIAGAVAQSKELILLDEPTSHLDLSHTGDIEQLLKKLHAKGSTIITVLHDINSALAISQIIIALDKGTIVFHGSPEEFVEQKIADRIYGINSVRATHPSRKTPYLFFGDSTR